MFSKMINQDQTQDYSVVVHALDALEQLKSTDEQINRLKEQRAQQKVNMIEDLGELLKEVPAERAFVIASDAYWANPLLADAIKRAYVLATGKGLLPRPMPTEVSCERCGNLITATSWTNYNHIVVNAERRKRDACSARASFCLRCNEAQSAERDQKNSAYFRTWQEQCEEEAKGREQILAQFQAMNDDEYFETEHWQLIAQAMVKKVGFRCQLCNTGEVLKVHLRSQECRGCESLADLVVLCRECSGSFHLIEEIRNS